MSDFAPAVEFAVKIMSFLAESEKEVGISEISRGLDLNKNMVFRVLNSLEKEGWVYCNNQKYALTLLPFKVSSSATSRMSLNTAAVPGLYELLDNTGASTYLGVLSGDKVLYIQHLDGTGSVRVSGRVGGEYDLYCSAPGKVLLAYAGDDFIEEYTSREFEKRTQNSITEKAQILKELQNIRINGYATDREEFGNGIVCVSAPVFDYKGDVVGAVGCSSFALTKNGEEIIKELLPHVLSASKEISTRLGGELKI